MLTGLLAVATLALAVAPTQAAPSADGTAPGDSPTEVAREFRITYFFVPSLHSRPFRITPGPDGNLWFTNTDSDTVGKITTSGLITEYPIGDGKVPYDLVAGRDGNIWFTENVNNKVGAIDTNGNLVHEYYAPGVDARPTGITVAPTGDIWWVHGGSGQDVQNEVARLHDGIVTVFELFPCACFGLGITVGPDSRLWAVEELGVFDGEAKGTIDRISLNGRHVARFGIPAPQFTEQHLPAWAAPGPDGRVWFTEFNTNLHQVGAVTHNGAITEYVLPGGDSNTGSITTGVDGRLWVTEPGAEKVTILRPDGSFVNSMHVHQLPFGITIGPDGNMWFTNSLSGEIGRIQTAEPGVGYVLNIASGFVPAERTVALGHEVQWVLEAPGLHQVRDATGLSLYDSGLRPPVSFLRHRFTGAGTFAYSDPATGDSGSIAVPVEAPASGRAGAPVRVTWASAAVAPGLVFDVQVLGPRSGTWVTWRSGVTSTSDAFVATAAGTYQFRARLRLADGSAGSDWSPARSVAVA